MNALARIWRKAAPSLCYLTGHTRRFYLRVRYVKRTGKFQVGVFCVRCQKMIAKQRIAGADMRVHYHGQKR